MSAEYEFVLRVLRLTSEMEEGGDFLWWRTDGEYAPVTFFVNCNDTFWWGTGDVEPITPDNIAVLEQAAKDCADVDEVLDGYAGELFCARVRKMRPQGAAYPKDARLWPLFDACGPERIVALLNPKPQPAPTLVAEGDHPSSTPLPTRMGNESERRVIRVRDLRRARAALAAGEQAGEVSGE